MNQATVTSDSQAVVPLHPCLEMIMDHLLSDMFSAARVLRGELLDAFWRSVDELTALRHAPTTPLSDALPKQLVLLGGEHQKAWLMRLRIDMFSVAKALHGEILDSFWKALDELMALRTATE